MRLTKYEEVRILSARALQISMGAPLLIKRPKEVFRVVDIAELEFEKGLLTMSIHKIMPKKMGGEIEKESLPVIDAQDELEATEELEEDLSEEDIEVIDEG